MIGPVGHQLRMCSTIKMGPNAHLVTPHLTLRFVHLRVCVQTDRLWLYEKFAPFGAVLSVKVLTNEAGVCKGVGFINYGDQDAAHRAVAAMNGMPIGGDKRLHVAIQTHRNR